jgi:3',5'-cyclic AMP phosphodiesterase CpdA
MFPTCTSVHTRSLRSSRRSCSWWRGRSHSSSSPRAIWRTAAGLSSPSAQRTEPTASAPGLHVVGLNSARPFRQQGGALSGAQLDRAAARLAAAEAGALRVAVLHHHLLGAPWRAAHKRPVARRNHVFRALVDAGADLILAGHIHQAAVSERHEFEVVGKEARTAVVAIAPGLGQPRPRRLGEARGLHLHEADADAIVVRTFRWAHADWTLAAERRFRR